MVGDVASVDKNSKASIVRHTLQCTQSGVLSMVQSHIRKNVPILRVVMTAHIVSTARHAARHEEYWICLCRLCIRIPMFSAE